MVNGSELSLPPEMAWCGPLVELGWEHQFEVLRVRQPFAYLTIRHGVVVSETDDDWHVDGFSMRIPHIPEQNYVWCSTAPTEVAMLGIDIPSGFDPLRHNIQFLIQDEIAASGAVFGSLKPKTVYVLDPYVIHRRPPAAAGSWRTFIRLSFTAIPIDDRNNHVNPAFGDVTSDYDGVTDFRDGLLRHPSRRAA